MGAGADGDDGVVLVVALGCGGRGDVVVASGTGLGFDSLTGAARGGGAAPAQAPRDMTIAAAAVRAAGAKRRCEVLMNPL